MGILFKHFNLHEELNMTEDDTKNQTNRGISETVQVMFPHHFSRSYKVDVRMDLHKDLQTTDTKTYKKTYKTLTT